MRAVSKYCSMGLKRPGEFRRVTQKSNNVNSEKKQPLLKVIEGDLHVGFWEEEVKGEKCDLGSGEVSVAQSSN